MESDLEKALIDQLKKIMTERGKGFMYVGSGQRVTFGNTNYYWYIVFYNQRRKYYETWF